MSDTARDDGTGTGAVPPARENLPAARLAAEYGLTVSGARPPLLEYARRLWSRRHFVLAFSRAKLTAQYSQAGLGQLWQVATPLLNAAVYYFVFGMLLRTDRGLPNGTYLPFLVTGVFVFTFTQSSVIAGVRAISGNLGLVRALHFPRAALPVSFALQQLQQLLFSMIVLFAVVMAAGSLPAPSWLLVVPVLLLQFLFNTGLSLIVARMGAGTPDLAQLMPFLLRTWMYASGVMFSIDGMLKGRPEWFIRLMQSNPAAVYMDLMRFALIDGYGASHLPPHVWALALVWAVIFFSGGFVYFWKAEERYGRG
ncbi:ABC transporter permease [Streptomyces sp. SID625]|nr:ABC transporter permease [Streptomyces sp. SID625]